MREILYEGSKQVSNGGHVIKSGTYAFHIAEFDQMRNPRNAEKYDTRIYISMHSTAVFRVLKTTRADVGVLFNLKTTFTYTTAFILRFSQFFVEKR